MKKCLQDVKENIENKSALFDFFNPKIGMTSSKSLEELLWNFIANLQPMEVSFDLGPLSSIIIRNLFVMAQFSKLNLQINIKRVKGESFRIFLESYGSGFIRLSSKNSDYHP